MVSRAARILVTHLVFLLATLVCSAASQKSSVDAVLDSLFAVHGFREVAISPDGQRVAWVEALPDANGAPSGDSAIVVTSLASPAAAGRRITAGSGGPYQEHDIAWAPDSREVAFLSNAQTPDQLQLYVANVTGGSARKLTSLTDVPPPAEIRRPARTPFAGRDTGSAPPG